MVMLFPKTERTNMDLALTKGLGEPFDDITLEKIEEQNLSFLKPRIDINNIEFITLIPLAVIAFLALEK